MNGRESFRGGKLIATKNLDDSQITLLSKRGRVPIDKSPGER